MIFSEWGILESITPPEAGMGETEMDLSNQEYDALVRGKAQPSPLWKDLAWAFCVGGGICAVGQGLLEWYQSLGLEREQAGTARLGDADPGGGAAHRAGPVRQDRQAGGGGYSGAHHRLCQRHGLPGAGIQKRGLTYNRHTVGSIE